MPHLAMSWDSEETLEILLSEAEQEELVLLLQIFPPDAQKYRGKTLHMGYSTA